VIDFSEIPDNGEQWELFARDFLQEFGFVVEHSPDRGPDGGKDLLVSETLGGNLGNYRFRWLVSCKHFAKSNKSVQEKDEINIQERLASFNADGFLGFYSTIVSSGLSTRLGQLRETGNIKDYKVFDHRFIEKHLMTVGYSSIMGRYLPKNYKQLNPLTLVDKNYIPLNCQACGKDLLEEMYKSQYNGIVVFLENYSNEDVPITEEVYWCCKGDCDHKLRVLKESDKRATGWEDLGDLIIPIYFLNWIFANLNGLRSGRDHFTNSAFEELKVFITAISQRVFRSMTEVERERAYSLFQIPKF
jgi:hypothetical protein